MSSVAPMCLKHRFSVSQGKARPYVAANVGAYVIEQRMEIGLYSSHDTNVRFGLKPEAGLAIPMQRHLAAFMNARYNYAFAAGSVDDQSYVSFGLGVAWTHGR